MEKQQFQRDFRNTPQNVSDPKRIWRQIRTEMKGMMTFSPALLVPVVISSILLALFFLKKYIRWTVPCQSKKRLDGKTVIITGSNTGIGKATAYELCKRGAKVILACRNIKKGEAVARVIKMKISDAEVYATYLDLASLRSIKEFVYDFNDREPKLHILINNAAYMGPRATTDDGYERCFGVNYLGHFYLTYMLQEKLKKCAPSRIINVCSGSYTQARLKFEDLAMANYDIYKAYGRSKLALLQFNVEAHRSWYPDVLFSYAVHPGAVNTELMRNWPGIQGQLLRALSRFLFKTPEEGCQTIVYCAVADGIREQSGKMFENCKPTKTKDYIKDKIACRQLWNMSLQLCGLEEEPEIYDKEEIDDTGSFEQLNAAENESEPNKTEAGVKKEN